jgi:hypothetical protein
VPSFHVPPLKGWWHYGTGIGAVPSALGWHSHGTGTRRPLDGGANFAHAARRTVPSEARHWYRVRVHVRATEQPAISGS